MSPKQLDVASAAVAAEQAPSSAQSGPPVVPSDVDEEAATLAAFADVPSISNVHVHSLIGSKDGKQDLWVTVRL